MLVNHLGKCPGHHSPRKEHADQIVVLENMFDNCGHNLQVKQSESVLFEYMLIVGRDRWLNPSLKNMNRVHNLFCYRMYKMAVCKLPATNG